MGFVGVELTKKGSTKGTSFFYIVLVIDSSPILMRTSPVYDSITKKQYLNRILSNDCLKFNYR